MTKTETETENSGSRGCRFPVAVDRLCGRPIAPTNSDEQGRGAPTAYCDNPQHNRAAAWKARKSFARQQSGDTTVEAPEVLSRPVTSAGERAGQLLAEAQAMAEALTRVQERLIADLAVLGDPDAVAVELGTVTAGAEKALAAERDRAAQAEAGWLEDQAKAAEADAAAEELSEELATVRAELTGEIERLANELATESFQLQTTREINDQLDTDLVETRATNERLAGELAAEEERSATLKHTNEVLEELKEGLDTDLIRAQEEIRHLVDQLDTVTRERDEQRRRAEAADTKAEIAVSQVARLDVEVADLRGTVERQQVDGRTHLDQANRLGSENASVLAQLEAAKSALAMAENHGNQRVGDIERAYERQLGELRAEVERLRAPKK